MNSMKLTVASLIALKSQKTTMDIVISAAVLLLITVSALGSFCLLRKKHGQLKEINFMSKIGTLYQDKNVHRSKHKAHHFPLAFYFRRVGFASATVFMYRWPQM